MGAKRPKSLVVAYFITCIEGKVFTYNRREGTVFTTTVEKVHCTGFSKFLKRAGS